MTFYLPIAEIEINLLIILFFGFIVGFMSGLFGVGGGFLMTPLLIFMGIPPSTAVGTESVLEQLLMEGRKILIMKLEASC